MSQPTIPAGLLLRLHRKGRPLSPYWTSDRHSAPEPGLFPAPLERDPGDYEGKHRVDDARVGSVIVARFHNAPARLVTLSRMEVSA
ncbi:hypothetical protein [Mycolicibacterium fortuitum]|uniref:hypothetical protein n=1 Tax=Mycolicibacterium fortuitum TaxID=1766 RepID=UPI00241C51F2|nr:hypothetical protein [Mycolicibacterium fortuitum]MDG5773911.1 hypothetical protein [Mycolicibacterium fortuitum]MDG5779704.1 hypothetical protein [Mycolicibacterium fortuitum]